MKKANVSELRNRLSAYLRLVRRGQSVLVYDRDRPVARLDPIGASGLSSVADRFRTLVDSGALKPPTDVLPSGWLEARPEAKADVVAAVVAERVTGR